MVLGGILGNALSARVRIMPLVKLILVTDAAVARLQLWTPSGIRVRRVSVSVGAPGVPTCPRGGQPAR